MTMCIRFRVSTIGISTTNRLMAFILDGTRMSLTMSYWTVPAACATGEMNDSKTFNDADLNKSGYDYNRYTPIQSIHFWDTNVNRNGIVYDVADQIFCFQITAVLFEVAAGK